MTVKCSFSSDLTNDKELIIISSPSTIIWSVGCCALIRSVKQHPPQLTRSQIKLFLLPARTRWHMIPANWGISALLLLRPITWLSSPIIEPYENKPFLWSEAGSKFNPSTLFKMQNGILGKCVWWLFQFLQVSLKMQMLPHTGLEGREQGHLYRDTGYWGGYKHKMLTSCKYISNAKNIWMVPNFSSNLLH